MVTIQVALGMECVVEHELVCGEREERKEQRQEDQRRAEKRRKEIERQKAHFAKDVRGGTRTHVGKTMDFETGTRALGKVSRTLSYIMI